MAYTAPITEIEFCLKEIARIGDLAGLPGLGAYEADFRARQIALAGFFAETSLASAPGRLPGIIEAGDRFLDNSRALFGIE